MKNEKIKKSIKRIETYLASLVDKLNEDSNEKKIDNTLFIINFLTSSLLLNFKNIEFFKTFEKDIIPNLVEIVLNRKENTIEIDYSKILYAIDSLYSITETKYTTDDSVLIDKLTERYVEDIKKASMFCKTSFEKTGEKIIIFLK